MSRPIDWSPLGRDSDPVPGDSAEVERAGKSYQEVADAISLAARRLREIADHADLRSEAVEELRGKCREVADDIERAHTRYRGVGDALVAYAQPLATAQSESLRALRDAETAQAELAAAQGRASRAEGDLDRAADDADTTSLESALRQANGEVTAATTALARARTLCDGAVEDRDLAAQTAISAIREVEDSGGLNDGWWDNWGSKVVQAIAQIAGAIAAVAGIAALLVGWIPVIGQALAAVLGTIALVAAAISFLANLTLALTGDGTWSAVLLDAVSLATFGIGRAVISGGRAAYGGVRGAARLSAGRHAATSPGARAAAGLPANSSASAAIRAMTGGSNLSRSQARSLLQNAGRTPLFNLRAPFTTARRDLADFGTNLGTVFNRHNAGAAINGIPGAASNLRNSGSMTEFLAHFTQNSDTLAHLSTVRGLHPGLGGLDYMTQATALTAVGNTSLATGFGVDAFQLGGLAFGDSPTPAETLNLPGSP